ncbi:MAG: hypothetical protein FJ083_05775 [Cyanobacteria bacterium K_Offshore_surface_m2_239]|nr:hypothetical protein [Cyanobacteria bacterium K_Offshore_surface_m2_239]
MVFLGRHASAGLALGLLLHGAAPLAGHAALVYSASGAGITGSLGSQPFSNARWRLTATANEALATLSNFTIPTLGTFQLWWLPAAPQLTLETTSEVRVAELLPSPTLQWLVLSGRFPVGPDPKVGFVFTTPTTFNPETAAGLIGVPGSFINLQGPANFTGTSIFESNTYPSSAGDLVISSSNFVGGTFAIAPVPGPFPALAVAGAVTWSRRLRLRCAHRKP